MKRLFNLMMLVAGDYAPQFRKTLIYAAFASVLQALACTIWLPLLHELSRNKLNISQIVFWLLVMIITIVLEALLRINEQKFTYRYWHKVIEARRMALGNILYAMPLQMLRRREAGDIAETIGANVMMAASAISSLSVIFVQLIIVPVVLVGVILITDWKVGLVLFVACIATIPLVRKVQKDTRSGYSDVDAADARSAAYLIEYVQGLAVFKSVGQAGAAAQRLEQAFRNQHQYQSHTRKSSVLWIAGGQLIVQLALVLTVALGTSLVVHAQLSSTTLASIVVMAVFLSEPLGVIATMSKLFEMADTSLERIRDLLAEPPMPIVSNSEKKVVNHFDIQLDNVSFCYHGGSEFTLRNIDLMLRSGTMTALVGASGSGKSTVTRLLTRFADPQEGIIQFGGYNLKNFSPEELMRYISVVYQEVWLFDTSIKENIAIGKPDATQNEIEKAARQANIHETIMKFPLGYDTIVGESGCALSGGERQRISIARAILKDAPVIILDEPTSALDSESEYAVQKAIDALVYNKTVIVVAHRLSTIAGADQIVVMENGRILQQGTHQKLLTQEKSRYARMWDSQKMTR
ncbi:ABC transporter ATP-binding protein [Salmonella enterica]|nr:ABC transporter ATP-binding protein [Salmonella enterica]